MKVSLKWPVAMWIWLSSAATACSLQMPREQDVFATDGGRVASASGGSTALDGSQGGSQTGGSTALDGSQGGSQTGGSQDGSQTGGSQGGSQTGGSQTGGSQGGSQTGGSQGGSQTGGGAPGGDSTGGNNQPANTDDGGAGHGTDQDVGPLDPDDSLVAHFTFDDPEGSVAANRKDPSRNGVYFGSCTHPPGPDGEAVSIRNLNGLTTTTDWIELPKGLLSNLSATTLAIWVRDLSTAREGGRLFDFSRGSAENLYFSPDQVNPETSIEGAHLGGRHAGVSFVDLWTTKRLTDKVWHHVAVTWSAASINLYVDGDRVQSRASPGAVPSDLGPTSPNWLGRTLDDAFIALYAEIDDLRIYDKALTATHIAQLARR